MKYDDVANRTRVRGDLAQIHREIGSHSYQVIKTAFNKVCKVDKKNLLKDWLQNTTQQQLVAVSCSTHHKYHYKKVTTF
jgi:hypothetical protein